MSLACVAGGISRASGRIRRMRIAAREFLAGFARNGIWRLRRSPALASRQLRRLKCPLKKNNVLQCPSELILCSTICVPSATRHNIHMYPYFLFAAIHHLKSSPTFSVRPCSLVGRVTVDLIRRSWVRFPPRSKDFFFASCGSLFPFTRANAQWVIHGFK